MQLSLSFDSPTEAPTPIASPVSLLSRDETIAQLTQTRQALMEADGLLEKTNLLDQIAALEQHLGDEKTARAIEQQVCKQGIWGESRSRRSR